MKAPNKLEIQTYVKDGVLTQNKTLVKDFLKAWNNCFITITLHKKRNKRSNNQNAYYWGVIVPIIQNAIKNEWGELHSNNDVHEFLKSNCNYEEIINENTGQILRRVLSTTKNDTKKQEEFHERCRVLAKDFFNVQIPLPNEELIIKF